MFSMNTLHWLRKLALITALSALSFAAQATSVRLHTSMGDIVVELDSSKAPQTVANFESYVKSGHYEGTIFHRVIDGFMIQGGGFTQAMAQKPTQAPISHEGPEIAKRGGLTNARGTIAMARTGDPHSASAQFFINVKDNTFLDYRSSTMQGYGYVAFGRVKQGMDVVDKIKSVSTGRNGPFTDVPRTPVVILNATMEP
jgi:cyclophilin family peptidyl-prolyl cis-trans isomerase